MSPPSPRTFAALAAACTVAAVVGASCSSLAAPVAVAHTLGSRQCEPAGPTTPETLARSLRDAGLTVHAVACGHDGRMRPAVCGAPDGRLVIVEIPGDQVGRARALGWIPVADLPDVQRQPCR